MPTQRRSSGTGTITQRADGLWVGKIELPRDPRTGERRRKTVAGKTRHIVEGKIDELRLDLRQHGDLPTATMPLAKWLDYWLDNIDQSRPRTREGYRSKIEQYIKPAIGRIRIEQLTPSDVRKLEHYIVRERGLSSTSALQAYSILAKALKDAEREGRVVRNVARLVNPPRRAATGTSALSPTDAIEVLKAVEHDRLGSRWAAAFLAGARQGELLGLEIDRVGDFLDLSWQLQRITLVDGKLDAPPDWEYRHLTGGLYLSRPKSRAGWRMVPVAPLLRPVLEARIAQAAAEPNPHGLVWTAEPKKDRATRVPLPLDGMPIDPSKDSKQWHEVLKRASVPDVRLHDARHTTATLLYELDVPEVVIQQMLGQSTVAVTRGYRHASQHLAVQAMASLSQMLTPAQQPLSLAMD